MPFEIALPAFLALHQIKKYVSMPIFLDIESCLQFADAMNLGMMSGMFSGVVQEVLNNGAANLEKTLQGVVE